MVRVVRLGDGSLATGRTLPGRGAWLCRDSGECLDVACRRRAFERALRAPLAAGSVDRLKQEMGYPIGGPDHVVPESPVA